MATSALAPGPLNSLRSSFNRYHAGPPDAIKPRLQDPGCGTETACVLSFKRQQALHPVRCCRLGFGLGLLTVTTHPQSLFLFQQQQIPHHSLAVPQTFTPTLGTLLRSLNFSMGWGASELPHVEAGPKLPSAFSHDLQGEMKPANQDQTEILFVLLPCSEKLSVFSEALATSFQVTISGQTQDLLTTLEFTAIFTSRHSCP